MEDKEIEELFDANEEDYQSSTTTNNPTFRLKNNSNDKIERRRQVDQQINNMGADILNKLGVPKSLANKAVKDNGGKLSPTNLPANKLISNHARNKLANNKLLNNKLLNKTQALNNSDAEKLQNVKNQNVNNYNNLQAAKLNAKKNQEEVEKNESKNKEKKSNFKSLALPSLFKSKTKKGYESNGGTGNIDLASIIVKMPMIGIGLLIVIIVLIIFVTIGGTFIEEDESEVNTSKEVKGYITGSSTEDELVEQLVYLNLCRSKEDKEQEKEDCLNSPVGKYFTHVKELYEKYNKYTDINGNNIELNVNLILETISYGITDGDLFSDDNLENILNQADELAEAQVELYQEYGDLYSSSGSSCSISSDQVVLGKDGKDEYYRISNDKYISYLLYGKVHENYTDKVRKLDVDIHPDSDSNCIPSGRSYNTKQNLTDTTYTGEVVQGYIYLNINDLNTDDTSKILSTSKEIVGEIYKRANQTLNSGLSNMVIDCPGVIVTGEYEGTYSLEDYVAGVVQNENYWYQGDNIENMKAQAVAARTYVLKQTNNCTTPINNSTSKQKMNPNYQEKAKQAADQTAGQVLLDANNEYILTEYDALAVKEVTSDYYILKQLDFKIPVEWINSHISEANLKFYEENNHGRGMSQWGSRYLQTQGYTYDQILSTFYLSASLSSSLTADIPSNVDDVKNRYYFTYDMNSYVGKTTFGQCVWYAVHRAMEIIATSNLDDATKETLIKSIRSTGGNGIDWYAYPSNTYFKKSKNINEPKAGSIVSWAWTQEKCIKFHGTLCDNKNINYGHVAIVERVYTGSNGQTMVTLTDGYRTKCSRGSWCVTSDMWSVVNVRRKELTLQQLNTYSGIFNGYVYLY